MPEEFPSALPGGSMDRMVISSNSIAHVRLTVTNIERSRQFYESVFGWPVLLEVPDNADEATRGRLDFLSGGVVYDLGGALIGLRPVASDLFDEDRVGLDHISFRTGSKPNWTMPLDIWMTWASGTSPSKTSGLRTFWSSATPTTLHWS